MFTQVDVLGFEEVVEEKDRLLCLEADTERALTWLAKDTVVW